MPDVNQLVELRPAVLTLLGRLPAERQEFYTAETRAIAESRPGLGPDLISAYLLGFMAAQGDLVPFLAPFSLEFQARALYAQWKATEAEVRNDLPSRPPLARARRQKTLVDRLSLAALSLLQRTEEVVLAQESI